MSPESSAPAPRKRCTVAFATRERQYLWSVELPSSARIAEALAAARTQAADEPGAAEIPWDAGLVDAAALVGRESDSTPMDVPLHPGAARWYREHG